MANSEIVLEVQNSCTFIYGKLEKSLYQELKEKLGYIDPNYMWTNNYANKYYQNQKPGLKTTVCYNKTHCKCFIKKTTVLTIK